VHVRLRNGELQRLQRLKVDGNGDDGPHLPPQGQDQVDRGGRTEDDQRQGCGGAAAKRYSQQCADEKHPQEDPEVLSVLAAAAVKGAQ